MNGYWGLRAAATGKLILEDVRVPEGALLGAGAKLRAGVVDAVERNGEQRRQIVRIDPQRGLGGA